MRFPLISGETGSEIRLSKRKKKQSEAESDKKKKDRSHKSKDNKLQKAASMDDPSVTQNKYDLEGDSSFKRSGSLKTLNGSQKDRDHHKDRHRHGEGKVEIPKKTKRSHNGTNSPKQDDLNDTGW